MRLETDLVRRLGSSHFNYWFGYAANSAWVIWLISRGLVSGPQRLPPARLIILALAGAILWTFAEYILHRFVYHVIPSFLSQGHLLHHQAPRELIGVPWWLTSAILFGIYELFALVLDPGKLGAVMAGVWLGYIGYCLLHHGSHHWPMRPSYLRRVKQRHQLHHVYPGSNWGFTTPLWDIVFGTYLSPAHAKTRRNKARCANAKGAPGAAEISLPQT